MAQQNPWDAAPVVSRSRANSQAANPWDAAPVVAPASPQASAPRASAPRQQRPAINFTDDRDALIRTVIGEAAAEPPEGQAAVAAVVLNRARQRGMSPREVVLEANQFEPWGNPQTAARLVGIAPTDPRYQAAAAQVDRALGGYDPTNGADHFFAPRAQATLGRQVPSWAQGEPLVIGGHNFYSLGGSTEDARMAAAQGGAPVEEVVAAEEVFAEPVADAAPVLGTRENPVDITNREQVQLAKKGDWVRLANGDLTQAAGEAVQGQAGEQQAPGIYARESNLADSIGAGATAAGEQIPFLDEAAAGVVGLTSGLGYDAIRDRQAAIRATDNEQYRPARVAGGITGFGAGLAAPGGAYIRGATGLARAGRAAQVGAGYGALYGGGAADDSWASRLSGLAQGAAIGGATGGLVQMGADRLGRLAQEAVGRAPSQARLLSREGVDLTPGMMAAEVPVIGNTIRSLEEGASSIPFVGQPIAGARQQAVESFSNAAVNRALGPIGERLPRRVNAGYDAVEYAQQAFGRAYDNALRDVNLAVDQSVIDRIGEALVRVADEAGEPQARALTNAIRNRVFRGLDEVGQTIDGQQFKALESELGTLAREAGGASDGATRTLGTAYGDVQRILREALQEQNPQASEQLQRVNRGYATMARINDAASSTAAFADDGVFTPTQLGRAVSRGGSTNQLARGDALMQDLAVAGRGIIPSRVGDSGTATRGAVTGVVAGLASGTPLVGPLAVPVIATSIAYSRPAQQALNAIYRASDSPGAAQRHLRRLANLAQREPALQPYYQEAVRFVTGQEPLRPQEPGAPTRMPEERLAG